MRTILFWILFLLGVSAFLASCGSMKKNRSEVSLLLDTSSVSTAQEVEIKKDNSLQTATRTTDISGDNIKLKIIYGDADQGKVNIQTAELKKGFDNKSAISAIVNSMFNSRMKELQLEIAGGFRFKDSLYNVMQNALYDSIANLKNDSTHSTKAVTIISEQKERKGLSISMQVVLWMIIALIALLFFVLKRTWFVQLFIKIKNIMKKILSVLIVALMLFSCNNPDGKVYPADPEPAGWDHGVQAFTEYVVIKPTWWQSFYFAFKDGYTWQFAAGLFLIVVSAGMFYAIGRYIIKANIVSIPFALLLLAGGVAFIMSLPGTIKSNNNIKVEKQRYEASKGDLPALWDKFYEERQIVGTSGK